MHVFLQAGYRHFTFFFMTHSHQNDYGFTALYSLLMLLFCYLLAYLHAKSVYILVPNFTFYY